VGEDQALEIWDAQKDTFRGVKNSMTLHKGYLGIGTEEPEGRLAVLDEPHNLEEFPPRAMTAEETYMEGYGVFKATADSHGAGNTSIRHPWKAFIKGTAGSISNGDNSWLDNSGDFNSTTGVYDGSLIHHSGSVSGEYLQLELPYEIQLSSYSLAPWNYPTGTTFQYSDFPRDFIIYGSKDSITWDIVDTRSSQSSASQADVLKYHVNSQKTYKYFVIVVTKINTATYANSAVYVAIGEWRLFGTREQRQSVLHDGQLTLTKNLTVPRIGPALDADDTPRRDRLVVEYNTSTNPTFDGAVRDTSGRGNDGVMGSGVSYDASEKSLILDNSTGGFIHRDFGSQISGNFIHSISMWVKGDTFATGNIDVILWIGDNVNNKRVEIYASTTLISYNFKSNQYESSNSVGLADGVWNHIAFTYNGQTGSAGREIYVNGKVIAASHSGNADALNITNGNLYIGSGSSPGNGYDFDGSLSNFKLYDTALTAEEVKTLYDMGRCDEGHHVVNFSKTRVGIGLGDGEAPRGALDVRDTGILSKGYIGNPYNGGAANRTGDLVIKQSGDVNDDAKTSGIRMYRAANDTNSWHFGVNNGTNFQFSYNNSSMGYLGRTDVSVIDFTGQHRSFLDGVSYTEYDNLEGLIVSANKNKYYDIDENITAGINAIQISQSLPLVSLSTEEKDKACFGVISGSEDPKSREYTQGSFVSVVQKQKGDTRVFINSVGEGAIWVVNTNGSLDSGDYITTSNVTGYGQKQDSDSLKNYTVAKITMDCDFEPATQPIQIIKKDEEGENVLDEYGQIQWEDHPTETEKAYKIRYLDADGNITDEANAVHIAAFVGCTYHCG